MTKRMKPNLRTCILAIAVILCGCASTLDVDSAVAIAPYHIGNGGRIVVEVRVNDQGPFHFALDTGASISVVFDRLRRQLELESVAGESIIIHGLVDSGLFPLLSISRLQVGRETWLDPRVASLPGETAAGADFDGILGIDFLQQYAVGFSTEDRVLRLYSPQQIRDKSYRGWASVPLKAVNIGARNTALFFFETEFGGQKVPALFDLGAGLNMINWPAAHFLRLAPEGHKRGELLSGALESTPVMARFNAAEVSTAGIRWQNEAFLVADLAIFATLGKDDSPFVILGSGLFNQRDFLIDFVRNRLLVKTAMEEVLVSQ
jgi:aspartyl protease